MRSKNCLIRLAYSPPVGLVAEVGITGAAMPGLIGHYNRREKFCCRFAADGGERNNPHKF
jgi:hypothetical protein